MKIAVPREIVPGERRVALTPDATAALVKAGLDVLIEAGAGGGAFHADGDFEERAALPRGLGDLGRILAKAHQ